MSRDSGGHLPSGLTKNDKTKPGEEKEDPNGHVDLYNLDLNLEWSIPIENQGGELVSVYLDRWSEETKDTMLQSRAAYHWKHRCLRDGVLGLRKHAVNNKMDWKRRIVADAHNRQRMLGSGFRKWRIVHSKEIHPIKVSSKIAKLESRKWILAHALCAKWLKWVELKKFKREQERRAILTVSKPRIRKALREWWDLSKVSAKRRSALEGLLSKSNGRMLRSCLNLWIERYHTQKMIHILQRKVSKRSEADSLRYAFTIWRFDWLNYKRRQEGMADKFIKNALVERPMSIGQFLLAGQSVDKAILKSFIFSIWKAQAMYQRRLADGIDFMTASIERAIQRNAIKKWLAFTQDLMQCEIADTSYQNRALLTSIRRWKSNITPLPMSLKVEARKETHQAFASLRNELMALNRKRRSNALRNILLSKAIATWKEYIARGYLQYGENGSLESVKSSFQAFRGMSASSDGHKKDFINSIEVFISDQTSKINVLACKSKNSKLSKMFPLPKPDLPPRTKRRALLQRISSISRMLIDEQGLLRSSFAYWKNMTLVKQSFKKRIADFIVKRKLAMCKSALVAWHELWLNSSMKEFLLTRALRRSIILMASLESQNSMEWSDPASMSLTVDNQEVSLVNRLIQFHKGQRARNLKERLCIWFASAMKLRSTRIAAAALSISYRSKLKREAFEEWKAALVTLRKRDMCLQERAKIAFEQNRRNHLRRVIENWRFFSFEAKPISEKKCLLEKLKTAKEFNKQRYVQEYITLWKIMAKSGTLRERKKYYVNTKKADLFRSKRLFQCALAVWKERYKMRSEMRVLEASALTFWATKLQLNAFGIWVRAVEKQRGSIKEALKEKTLIEVARRLRQARQLGVSTVALLDLCNYSRETKNGILHAGISKEEIMYRARAQALNLDNEAKSEDLTALIKHAVCKEQNPNRKHTKIKKQIKLQFPPVEGSTEIIHSICRSLELPIPSNIPVGAELMSIKRLLKHPFIVTSSLGTSRDFELRSSTLEGQVEGGCIVNFGPRHISAISSEHLLRKVPKKRLEFSWNLKGAGNIRLPPRIPYALLHPPKTTSRVAMIDNSQVEARASRHEQKDAAGNYLPANLLSLLNDLENRKHIRATKPPAMNLLEEPCCRQEELEASATAVNLQIKHRTQPRRPEFLDFPSQCYPSQI